jgi:FtsH-binding integral membrane protein
MDASTRRATRRTPPASRAQSNGSGPDQAARKTAAPQERAKQQAVLVAVGAPGGLAAAVIVWITAFQIVHWTDFQTALVTAEAVTLIGLIGALVGHFWRESSKEPVALAATLTATFAATLALGNGFGWMTWSQDQTTAVLGVFTAVLGVCSALFARSRVDAKTTPKKAEAKPGPTKLRIIKHPRSAH